jgi:O-antigen ligase
MSQSGFRESRLLDMRGEPPVWRNPAQLSGKTADIFATLSVLALPWSTSLFAVFVVAWLVTLAPTSAVKPFMQSLKRPVCALPIALFVLALVGTLWSDAPWSERLYAIGPTAKLLMLPVLIFHFERSTRGIWLFVTFLISCALLMVMSWVVAYAPQLALKSGAYYGIPVKNYIDQSQEFTLCAVAVVYPIVRLFGQKRFTQAALLAAIGLSLVANMAFVVVSRTALVTVPIMLLVFALRHLERRNVVIVACSIIVLAGVSWVASPYLQARVETLFTESRQLYLDKDQPTSMSVRLEFWRKSLRFFAQAPIVGSGTGSTHGLFEQAAAGQIGAAAFVVENPHNQTMNVAVQWGLLGIVLLYGMWWFHLRMFRGDGLANWIGLLVVVQNIFTSLFNSHLFDFHEGWMYVLGVGIGGGMTLRLRSSEAAVPASTGELSAAKCQPLQGGAALRARERL